MLSHEIIKFKEKVVAHSAPWRYGVNYENTSNITKQEHLDEFLKGELKVGQFVRYKNGLDGVYNLYQMNVVLCVERDFNKIKIGYTRFPETHLLLQCNISDHSPWIRWVDIREYVEITPADRERLVNDKLFDYIERVKATSEVYKKATAESC